jgi:hypothetical protein
MRGHWVCNMLLGGFGLEKFENYWCSAWPFLEWLHVASSEFRHRDSGWPSCFVFIISRVILLHQRLAFRKYRFLLPKMFNFCHHYDDVLRIKGVSYKNGICIHICLIIFTILNHNAYFTWWLCYFHRYYRSEEQSSSNFRILHWMALIL